ncbi:MAG: hypothetical protein CTY34_01890 [Methylobacter sp.]|nr:MAG: hypothetical protein CTY34_01890 [Methylobacter sp.]PPD04434.1 MAG: hypothetical protein CTY29_05685 [Methylobacter sp.]PPD22034.1 MAG: hypothetical protein CTY24_06950 [Methylobacter sp.]PPD37192.1 MAG: hypothetical protein CTY18_02475 [Methylomonas sp.]
MSLALSSQTNKLPSIDYVEKLFDSIVSANGGFNIEGFWSAIDEMERILGIPYVRLDFGVPGLTPSDICLSKHSDALLKGDIPHHYPPYSGLPKLCCEVSVFIQNRLGIACRGEDVFVTCGGTQALFTAQAIGAHLVENKHRILFLTPTYPPMMSQARFLGLQVDTLELDDLRGERLISKIHENFMQGDVAAICWASPNNPTWSVLDAYELENLAKLCRSYGVLPIEDLTYLGMSGAESNNDSIHFPSIAQYSDEYFLVLSTSKMLSYAGERIGFLIGSPALLNRKSSNLEQAMSTGIVRRACSSFIFNLTAGAPHSAQYGVAEAFAAINNGMTNLDQSLSVYSRRSEFLKSLLDQNGFYPVYDHEFNQNANGFYVCFGYPGLSGLELLKRLLSIGVAVLPLTVFSSLRNDGVRACVGRLDEQKINLLAKRLGRFSGEQNYAVGF